MSFVFVFVLFDLLPAVVGYFYVAFLVFDVGERPKGEETKLKSNCTIAEK